MGNTIGQRKDINKLRNNTLKKIKLGAPCKYNFYIIRHGFSCSNFETTKIVDENPSKIKQKYLIMKEIGLKSLNEDSHLSNWGILSCNLLRKEYVEYFKDKHIDNLFVSPLIRTWETAYLLFGSNNINRFNIAKNIKEENPLKYLPLDPFDKQIDKFRDFIEYVNYLKKILNLKYNYNENYPIKPSKNIYNKVFLNNSLDKFIKEYIKENDKKNNFSSENNAIVVCHSQLIEDFMDKYKFNYNSNMLRNFKKRNNFVKDNNAYCIKITIDRSINKPLEECINAEIVNQGFPFPNQKELRELNLEVSDLCVSNQTKLLTRNSVDNKIQKEYEKILEINNNKYLIKNFGL